MKKIGEFFKNLKEKFFPSGKKSFLSDARAKKGPKQKVDWATWKRRNLNWNGLGKFVWMVLRFIIIVGIAYMILFPFVVKVIVAFESTEDIVDNTVMYVPRHGSTYFIERAMLNMDYWASLGRTAMLSLIVAVFQLFVASVAGYGFARFQFKGRDILFFIVLLTLMIPTQTIQLPLFVRFSHFLGTDLNLINTFWPLTILSATGLGLKNGLYIYLMRQFFRGLPKELENSAYIDGAGFFRTFLSIMLPNAMNMMITVFLFAFTWQWTDTTYNQMLMPKLGILSNKAQTVASSIEDTAQIAAINDTACLLIIFPLLIVFLIAQRYFIQSIERSGMVE